MTTFVGAANQRRQHMTKEGREKISYASLDEALAAAVEIQNVYARYGLDAYQCRVCDLFHLGRMPRAKFRELMKRSLVSELGVRAADHMMRENYGDQILVVLRKRWRAIERRGQ